MTTSQTNGRDEMDVRVMAANNAEGRRAWDKKHCCVFCMQLYAKLPRHFEQCHKDELDVIKTLSYPMKSKERRLMFDTLRNSGDFAHNIAVLKSRQGVLIPWRRPSEAAICEDYLPCDDCLAWFLKRDLWKHKKNCPKRKKQLDQLVEGKPKRSTHQASGAALLPVSREAESQMRTLILDTMANDEIATVVRRDDLIVQFGRKLFSKNGHEKHQHQYIKQKMREIARFLICMRKDNVNVRTLADCINPVLFKRAVRAVKTLCGYNEDTGAYKVPSLALKLGQTLGKCAKYLRASAIQSQNDSLKRRAEDYKDLIQTEWNSEVSSQALAMLHSNTFNTTPRIPLAEDLKELNKYLAQNAGALKQLLQQGPDSDIWRQLAEVTLAQVVLFNRRRGGEMERMNLMQYHRGIAQGPGSAMQEEVAAALSPFEKSLAEKLSRVEIRGKRGRKVPVLLIRLHKEQIDLLNRRRHSCGINVANDYLFARVGDSKTPIRTSDVLRKYTNKCGAKQPDWITSTSLRKHVATVSQLLNLKDNEIDLLAGFMGHDIQIHRKYYRLPENTLQLAKVSKVLLQLENGNIQKYKGMSLDEMQLDEGDVIEEEELDKEEEDGGEEEQSEEEHSPSLRRNLVKQESSGDDISPRSRKINPKTAYKRTPWTETEKDAVKRQLGTFIRLRKVPGKRDCENAKALEQTLDGRPWQQVKFCVKNIISSHKKRIY